MYLNDLLMTSKFSIIQPPIFNKNLEMKPFQKTKILGDDEMLESTREYLYSSNMVSEIEKFYLSFQNKYQLFDWMKKRVKTEPKIVEVNKSSNDIVVIPTANVNGKWSKAALDTFKGFHIIFVESAKDNFFNLSHSFNVGFKLALEYSPNWIVFSNDDMIAMESPQKLREALNKAEDTANALFINELIYGHSYLIELGNENLIGKVRAFSQGRNIIRRELFESRFGVKIKMRTAREREKYHSFKKIVSLSLTGDFGILNSAFVKKLNAKVFDETFIHGAEDIDLSVRLMLADFEPSWIDFSIGSIGGGTRGKTQIRWLKDVANFSYLNYKLTSLLLPKIESNSYGIIYA